MQMNAKQLFQLSLLLFLLAAFFGFELINLLVSWKYGTDGPNECISRVTHTDLCAAIRHCKMLGSACLAAGLLFLGWSARMARAH
jgi:hypothetical protein